MSKEYLFWKNQKLLKDYREKKLFFISTSALFTSLPALFMYGMYYENFIRKIPFHIQIASLIIFYKSSFRMIQEIIYQKEKIEKDLKENIQVSYNY